MLYPLSSRLTYTLKKGRGLGEAPTVTSLLISYFDHEKSFDLPRPGGVCQKECACIFIVIFQFQFYSFILVSLDIVVTISSLSIIVAYDPLSSSNVNFALPTMGSSESSTWLPFSPSIDSHINLLAL